MCELVGGYLINLSPSSVVSQKNSFINILLFMQQRRGRKTNTTHKERRLFQFARIRYKEEISRNIHKEKHTMLRKAD